jgi:hypothetical protein
VRSEDDVVHFPELRVDFRLPLVHVEARREKVAGRERVGQGGLVDDRTPGRVHEHARGLHRPELLGPEQVVGLR